MDYKLFMRLFVRWSLVFLVVSLVAVGIKFGLPVLINSLSLIDAQPEPLRFVLQFVVFALPSALMITILDYYGQDIIRSSENTEKGGKNGI